VAPAACRHVLSHLYFVVFSQTSLALSCVQELVLDKNGLSGELVLGAATPRACLLSSFARSNAPPIAYSILPADRLAGVCGWRRFAFDVIEAGAPPPDVLALLQPAQDQAAEAEPADPPPRLVVAGQAPPLKGPIGSVPFGITSPHLSVHRAHLMLALLRRRRAKLQWRVRDRQCGGADGRRGVLREGRQLGLHDDPRRRVVVARLQALRQGRAAHPLLLGPVGRAVPAGARCVCNRWATLGMVRWDMAVGIKR
jgi:hypothetical protein